MGYDYRLASGVDEDGNAWIMCPLCFEANGLISARDGGRLSTEGQHMSDICVDCAATDWLYFANMMGA